MEAPAPPMSHLEQSTIEELLSVKFTDTFYTEIRRRLRMREGLAFVVDDSGILVRTSAKCNQIAVPQSLKE